MMMMMMMTQTASLRFTPWFTHWYQFYIPLQEREAELQETLRKARLDQGNLRGDPPVSRSVLRCHTADAECDQLQAMNRILWQRQVTYANNVWNLRVNPQKCSWSLHHHWRSDRNSAEKRVSRRIQAIQTLWDWFQISTSRICKKPSKTKKVHKKRFWKPRHLDDHITMQNARGITNPANVLWENQNSDCTLSTVLKRAVTQKYASHEFSLEKNRQFIEQSRLMVKFDGKLNGGRPHAWLASLSSNIFVANMLSHWGASKSEPQGRVVERDVWVNLVWKQS